MKEDHEDFARAFLGFDPGGDMKFGVAILKGTEFSATTVGNIEEAINWAVQICRSETPFAAGIDTLLHWATGRSGYRSADHWLRDNYPPARNSVIAPNSLRGAMTIGGIGLAMELRKKWPDICLNETHPKVLYHALSRRSYPRSGIAEAVGWLEDKLALHTAKTIRNYDELDAVLSAWCTRQALADGWFDLAALPPNDGSHVFPVKDVSYYWPPAQ